jgi:hypothetical protein
MSALATSLAANLAAVEGASFTFKGGLELIGSAEVVNQNFTPPKDEEEEEKSDEEDVIMALAVGIVGAVVGCACLGAILYGLCKLCCGGSSKSTKAVQQGTQSIPISANNMAVKPTNDGHVSPAEEVPDNAVADPEGFNAPADQ